MCLRDCHDGAGGCVYVNMDSAQKLGRVFKITCLHCSTSYFKVAMEACRFVRRFVTDWGIAYAWGLPFLPMCRHFQRPAYQSGSFLQSSVHMDPSTLSPATSISSTYRPLAARKLTRRRFGELSRNSSRVAALADCWRLRSAVAGGIGGSSQLDPSEPNLQKSKWKVINEGKRRGMGLI